MSQHDTIIHLVAGGVGGTVGAIATCPLEVVKTRLQSSSAGFYPPPAIKDSGAPRSSCKSYPNSQQRRRLCIGEYRRYSLIMLNHNGVATPPGGSATTNTPGIIQCLRYIVKNEGTKALFKGLVPNLVGVAPSRAIYFCTYAETKCFFNKILPPDSPLVHMCSAMCAGFVSCTATNPIWFVKTRLQLNHHTNQTSALECIKRIYEQSGIRGFYKGIIASYVGISETVVHFVIYEATKSWLVMHRGSTPDANDNSKSFRDFLEFMGAGAFSKTVASCIAYPHEVVRTRLREEGTKYHGFWQTTNTIISEEGPRGLYRGLMTQLVRQIPNTAIMMVTYEAMVYLLTRKFQSVTASGTTATQFYADAKGKRELA